MALDPLAAVLTVATIRTAAVLTPGHNGMAAVVTVSGGVAG
jgi:hypothetical protein